MSDVRGYFEHVQYRNTVVNRVIYTYDDKNTVHDFYERIDDNDCNINGTDDVDSSQQLHSIPTVITSSLTNEPEDKKLENLRIKQQSLTQKEKDFYSLKDKTLAKKREILKEIMENGIAILKNNEKIRKGFNKNKDTFLDMRETYLGLRQKNLDQDTCNFGSQNEDQIHIKKIKIAREAAEDEVNLIKEMWSSHIDKELELTTKDLIGQANLFLMMANITNDNSMEEQNSHDVIEEGNNQENAIEEPVNNHAIENGGGEGDNYSRRIKLSLAFDIHGALQDNLTGTNILPAFDDETKRKINNIKKIFKIIGQNVDFSIQHNEYITLIYAMDNNHASINGLTNDNNMGIPIAIGFGETAIESFEVCVDKAYNYAYLSLEEPIQ